MHPLVVSDQLTSKWGTLLLNPEQRFVPCLSENCRTFVRTLADLGAPRQASADSEGRERVELDR